MKRIVISLILILPLVNLFAQIPIGLKFDINGLPFDGYYDQMLYSPENKITEVHNSDSYEIGYYYDSVGNQVNGLIKFENDKIFFKKDDDEVRVKIRPEAIESLVIGVDSFFVINNFYYRKRLKTNPEFVKYITSFDDYTIAKHFHFTNGFAQSYGGQDPIVETFLIKHIDSTTWINFPDNNEFKGKAIQYFGHIPYLKEKIESREYRSENMLSIIKMAQYLNKFENNIPIYYDLYWQEVNNSKKAVFKAKILNKEDSIWTFGYYKNDTMLYEAKYSSFYPNIKNREFICYYADGNIRKTVNYKNNVAETIKLYSKRGELKYEYLYSEEDDDFGKVVEVNIDYNVVNDSMGNNVLGKTNKVSLFDEFTGFAYSQQFIGSKLDKSYRLLNSDTVFQITDPNFNFKTSAIQKKFDFYMGDVEYDDALSVNAQGIVFIYLVVNPKGRAVEGRVLGNIHPTLDMHVKSFLKNRLLETEVGYQHKFKAYKRDKTKRFYEVVIPIEFSINRFYRQSVNYYHFNHMNFHNHHMMMQQMNQHIHHNFTPPRAPMGF